MTLHSRRRCRCRSSWRSCDAEQAAALPREPGLLPRAAVAGAARRRERRLTFNYARAVIEKTASYTMSGVELRRRPGGRLAGGARAGAPRRAGPPRRLRGERPRPAGLRQRDRLLGAGRRRVQGDLGRRRRAACASPRRTCRGCSSGRSRATTSRSGGSPPATRSRTRRRRRRSAALPALGAHEGDAGAHRRRGVDGRDVRAVAGRHAGRGDGEPVRLHPVRDLPERARAEAVLGRVRPGGAEGAAARAEPRDVAALDDPGAVRQPDRRAGERDGGAGHRGAAGRGLGDPGEGARVPARPAAGRRRRTCTSSTRTWCCARCTTWRRCRAAPSARRSSSCPAWRCRWSSTRCSRRCSASG